MRSPPLCPLKERGCYEDEHQEIISKKGTNTSKLHIRTKRTDRSSNFDSKQMNACVGLGD